MTKEVTKPDIQYFDSDGTWVKPDRAVRVDIILKGGDSGYATGGNGAISPDANIGGGGGSSSGMVTVTPGGAVMTGAGGGGGRGGATVADVGPNLSAYGWIGTSDSGGELKAVFYPARDLPDVMPVEVGRGGRPGGRDGYALIVAHLEEQP